MKNNKISNARCANEWFNKTFYLFAAIDSSFGKYDDTELSIHLDNFGDAVRITRMIDVSCQTTG